jgi:hypothetical protein
MRSAGYESSYTMWLKEMARIMEECGLSHLTKRDMYNVLNSINGIKELYSWVDMPLYMEDLYREAQDEDIPVR